MTDQELRIALHQAIDHRLSGVREDPGLTQRVLAAQKGEKPMKKKLSISLILAILLILMASAALAARLGLFDKLAEYAEQYGDTRLSSLGGVSDVVGASVTTVDGITVEIDQCYYEGNRIFISYRVSGNIAAVETHEGAPDGEIAWDWEEKNFVCAERMISQRPESQKGIEWLNGEGQRWVREYNAGLHDGLFLADGTYLDIIGGDVCVQEDGSEIGWKECEIPEDRLADTLTFKAVLFRTDSIHYQDHRDYHMSTTRGEKTDILFTVKRNDRFAYIGGAFSSETYTATAEFVLGQIDMRGKLRVTCPEEWVRAHDDWDYHSETDLPEYWALYRGDQLISRDGIQGISREDSNTLCFEMLFPRPESADGLKLTPVYVKSGEHPQESIPLVNLINR